MQNKGAWLESLLKETETKKKSKNKNAVELDPYEVEFMYRPPEVDNDPDKPKEEVKDFCGAPLGLDPMKCFKCGKYGHPAASRACPMFTPNTKNEEFLRRTEDPMHEASVKYLVFI